MKSIGIVRKIDQLGRLVLPIELRNSMELPEGAPMEIYTDNNTIIIKKYQPGCVFCNSLDGVEHFKGQPICAKCRTELSGT
jgi:transcriptional pleiotropic regulator of transition state genes